MIAGVVVGAAGIAALIAPVPDRDGSAPLAAAAPVVSPAGTTSPSVLGATPEVPEPEVVADPSVKGGPTSEPSDPSTSRRSVEIKVSSRGPGTYQRAKVNLAAPRGKGRVITFDVRVERGLALDPESVAREIQTTLSDKRSWRGSDHVRFRLVSDPARARLHAYVATPGTTDRLCYPWLTRGAVSCQNGNRVVLNAKRWVFGARSYSGDLAGYREYLVNHEFGHALGYDHVRCPGKGRKAPVMMQQTKGLKGCRPNPWPTVAR